MSWIKECVGVGVKEGGEGFTREILIAIFKHAILGLHHSCSLHTTLDPPISYIANNWVYPNLNSKRV